MMRRSDKRRQGETVSPPDRMTTMTSFRPGMLRGAILVLAILLAGCMQHAREPRVGRVDDPAAQEAVQRAERFVAAQGYTELPPDPSVPLTLGPWDCLAFATPGAAGECDNLDTAALLRNRHATLEANARAYKRTAGGWLVYFRVATPAGDRDVYRCAAVSDYPTPVLPESECALTPQAVLLPAPVTSI